MWGSRKVDSIEGVGNVMVQIKIDAEAGNVSRSLSSGGLYMYGNVAVNKHEAVKWYTHAAITGYLDTLITLGA